MPRGRMLNKVISTSEKLSKISLHSALLYTWMIPHLDVQGKIFGNPEQIKGIVVPYRKEFTIKKIENCLKELSESELVLIYGDDCKYILLNGFENHQTVNPSKEAPSNIPDPSPDLLQSKSRATPGEVKLSKDKISEDKEEEQLTALFSSALYPPKLLEKEFISEIYSKFGYDKCKIIIRKFAGGNFRKVDTMREALNPDGTIKPKDSKQEGITIEHRPA